jgi:hypothetical protein
MVGSFMRAVPAMPVLSRERFPWHEPDTIGELAAGHGVDVIFHEGLLSITDSSLEA